jgi:hypothetical protein
VQTIRKNVAVVLVIVVVVASVSKYFSLMGIDGWGLDLVHAIINLFLTLAMVSIPLLFLKKANSTKIKAISGRLMGFAVAFTVFMFYILLFIARVIMMMEYYAGNSTMLTLEFLVMGLLLFALLYPLKKQGKQQGESV